MSEPVERAKDTPCAVRMTFTRRAALASAAGALVSTGLSGLLMTARGDTRTAAPAWKPDDDFFGEPFVDQDEWREHPVRHRYVHGGFQGTDTRFSCYFPPPERYAGRFLHALQGGSGGNENTAQGQYPEFNALFGVVPSSAMEHAFDCGGYLVESNQGHFGDDLAGAKGDAAIIAYRASAVSARYARVLAAQMYGAPPHHGYIYGGSGGGIRSINCFERVPDLWDGIVPLVMPHQMQGHFYSIHANVRRLLGAEQLARVADAVAVGGSGRPFDGLDGEQAQALATLYKTGFPRGVSPLGNVEASMVFISYTRYLDRNDPTYWEDFWNKPGYAGHDSPQQLQKHRIATRARVERVLTAGELRTYQPSQRVVDQYGVGELMRGRGMRSSRDDKPVAVVLKGVDTSRMSGAAIRILSGAAAGRELFVQGVIGDALVPGSYLFPTLFEGVRPGDELSIDNSKFIAYSLWHRHQVQPRFPEWNHSMVDGRPMYVQRPFLNSLITLPFLYRWPAGNRRMIIVQNMADPGTWPCGPVSYMEKLRPNLDAALDQRFRVYFNEHAQHGPPAPAEAPGNDVPVQTTRLVHYHGVVNQALKDVIAWVEQGKAPPRSTEFHYTSDSEVVLTPSAPKRCGLQPVVQLTANGAAARVEVAAGTAVKFEASTEMPPEAGVLIAADWDFDGRGLYPMREPLDGKSTKLTLRAAHTYREKGVYFAAVRVAASRNGNDDARLYRTLNLGRIRVVVT